MQFILKAFTFKVNRIEEVFDRLEPIIYNVNRDHRVMYSESFMVEKLLLSW